MTLEIVNSGSGSAWIDKATIRRHTMGFPWKYTPGDPDQFLEFDLLQLDSTYEYADVVDFICQGISESQPAKSAEMCTFAALPKSLSPYEKHVIISVPFRQVSERFLIELHGHLYLEVEYRDQYGNYCSTTRRALTSNSSTQPNSARLRSRIRSMTCRSAL